MPSSERIIGFSTGAIAKGDFRRALGVLKDAHVCAVELSALREHELPELARSFTHLDLEGFEYVSVHAPSNFKDLQELDVVELLQAAASHRLPIVAHPDTIQTFDLWKPFGPLLLIENMDKRKPIGRTASELTVVFHSLPEAGLCFDVAHARQVDPSMIEAAQILKAFGGRLREVHASGVTHLIPEAVPVILESPVNESMIHDEINFARDAFSPWLEKLQNDIDDVLDLKVETLRRTQAENFLKILRMTNVKMSDFENVISHLPTGGAFRSGEIFFTARDLLNKLSEGQKMQLKRYLFNRLSELAQEYPDLKSEFREQFASVD